MDIATASFDTTLRQMTEMSQQKWPKRRWKMVYLDFGNYTGFSGTTSHIVEYRNLNQMVIFFLMLMSTTWLCEQRFSNILESKSTKKNSVKIVYIRTRGELEIRLTKLRLSQPLDKIQ